MQRRHFEHESVSVAIETLNVSFHLLQYVFQWYVSTLCVFMLLMFMICLLTVVNPRNEFDAMKLCCVFATHTVSLYACNFCISILWDVYIVLVSLIVASGSKLAEKDTYTWWQAKPSADKYLAVGPSRIYKGLWRKPKKIWFVDTK